MYIPYKSSQKLKFSCRENSPLTSEHICLHGVHFTVVCNSDLPVVGLQVHLLLVVLADMHP
jgi:hypothetical protein